MAVRLHVQISGRVQGVGFRYATRGRAYALRLSGWVANLPDGRVEAEFEGPRDSLESVLSWCRKGPPGARVSGVAEHWEEGEARYEDFLIRR